MKKATASWLAAVLQAGRAYIAERGAQWQLPVLLGRWPGSPMQRVQGALFGPRW